MSADSSPRADPASVAVIIPSYQRSAELTRCLNAVAKQTRRPDAVVVVARATDDATRQAVAAMAKELPLRVVDAPDKGAAVALQAGFDATAEEVVAVTDDDAVPRADWLEKLLAAYASSSDVVAVGGRDIVHEAGARAPSTNAPPVVGRVSWYGRCHGNHHLGFGPPRDVHYLKGANMSVRRGAHGLPRLPSDLRGSGTQPNWEIGLFLPVAKTGGRIVYDPAVLVDHYPARRPDDDGRHAKRGEAVYNETLALLRYGGFPRVFLYGAWSLLVGSTVGPGVLVALRDRSGWLQVRAVARARLGAWSVYFRGSRA